MKPQTSWVAVLATAMMLIGLIVMFIGMSNRDWFMMAQAGVTELAALTLATLALRDE
jgi:hypothetical protein